MRIHAYSVSASGGADLELLLEEIGDLDLEDRLLQVGSTDMRLELADNRRGVWYLDFAKIRYEHGPGRAPRAAPIRGFRLQPDEGFGEETAAIFYPGTGYLLVQYNHFGPRSAAIETYLNSFLDVEDDGENDDEEDEIPSIDLGAVLRPNVFAELRRKQIIKSLEFTVSVPGIRAIDRQAGTALSALADVPLPGGVQKINFKMSASRAPGAGLEFQTVVSEVRRLLRLDEGVTKLRAYAKDNEDAPKEPLDLLNAKLEVDLSINPGNDRRYSAEDRWRRLDRAYAAWRRNNSLPAAN